jgi:adenine-specific DNA-methyltransferase
MFSGDVGFRAFKLAASNIVTWEPNRDNIDQSLLESVEHLRGDRSEADILYEILLKFGLDLCVPIEKRRIADKDVHAVGGGILIACLAGTVDRSEVEALAQGIVDWHQALAPAGSTTCIFRDSAFADDVTKTNLVTILQQNALDIVRSI